MSYVRSAQLPGGPIGGGLGGGNQQQGMREQPKKQLDLKVKFAQQL